MSIALSHPAGQERDALSAVCTGASGNQFEQDGPDISASDVRTSQLFLTPLLGMASFSSVSCSCVLAHTIRCAAHMIKQTSPRFWGITTLNSVESPCEGNNPDCVWHGSTFCNKVCCSSFAPQTRCPRSAWAAGLWLPAVSRPVPSRNRS